MSSFFGRHASWVHTMLCVSFLPACVALAHPVAETGIADDWSYAHSAEVVAATGHIAYNGWSTAMLGWQLYWGALFIRLFGASWTVERISILVCAMLCTGLLHRLMVRCGIRPALASLGTLTVVLSPLFLPLAYSFMSDVPGLLAMLVCMYAVLRAVQASGERQQLGWVLIAIVSNVLLGTARQICWLGLIVLVPSALVLLREKKSVRLWGTIGWLAGLVCIWAELRWFQLQNYSLPEKLLHGRPHHWEFVHLANSTLDLLLGFPLFLLPLWLPMLVQVRWRRFAVRASAAVAVLLAGVVTLHLVHVHTLYRWLQPTLGIVVCKFGLWDTPFGPQLRHVVLTPGIRVLLSLLCLAATFAILASVLVRKPGRPLNESTVMDGRALLYLYGPFSIAYLLLLVSRATYNILYDRYLLIIIAIAAIATMRLWQRSSTRGMIRCGAVLVGIVAMYSVLSMHDLFALYRARLDAIHSLMAQGVPATNLRGDLEFDAMTEIGLTGYVNDTRLVRPAGAYHPVSRPKYWMEDFTPHVRPEYEFVLNNPAYGEATGLPPVAFRQWLGPHLQYIYIRRGPGISIVGSDNRNER